MKAYLINLDRSGERLAAMDRQLRALGIAYERVPGIEGAELAADAVPQSRLSPAETGCFLSHREAWRRIAEAGEAYGAVFEDDLHLAPALAAHLADDGWIPADADVVKLETMMRVLRLGGPARPALAGYRLARLLSDHDGGAGYVLSAATARRLLAEAPVEDQPVDAVLFYPGGELARSLTIYQIEPALVAQDVVLRGRADSAFPSLVEAGRQQRMSGDQPSWWRRRLTKLHRLTRKIGRFPLRIWRSLTGRERTTVVRFGGR